MPRFSQSIHAVLVKERSQPLTLAGVLAETSERGFALVILLLTLPFLFPMLPGMSAIFGSATLLLSVQMALGRRRIWLPRRIAQFQFSPAFTAQLLKNVERVAQFIEKATRPRWQRFAKNHRIWQINGLCISWLTLLLMLPVPLTNPIPAIGILLIAISSLEVDGLLMFIGYVFVGLNTALFGSIGYVLWKTPHVLQQYF